LHAVPSGAEAAVDGLHEIRILVCKFAGNNPDDILVEKRSVKSKS
jgi:hypothetical protein